MHQVVTAQLAARRAGTQSTKTRAEVRGGGAKPWKQKGTGRARQGSTRSPQWIGGGVALGPKPRSYAQKTPKKMIKLALRSALSDRAADGKVVVVDDWGFDVPSTKGAVAALAALGLEGRRPRGAVRDDDVAAWKSFRNLQNVHLLEAGHLNTYDVLVNDYVVFTRSDVPPVAPAAEAEGSQVKDPRDVIIKPVVSEKSYGLLDSNVYTFVVHPDASKPEIHDAVESIFGVRVLKVNTLNRNGKRKRNRKTGTFGSRPDTKRAFVTLADGDRIDLFEG